jgi:hypothetical protein
LGRRREIIGASDHDGSLALNNHEGHLLSV